MPVSCYTYYYLIYHDLARFSTLENPDIFGIVQYIMLYKAGEKWDN